MKFPALIAALALAAASSTALAESATGKVDIVGISGSGPSTLYTYDITLTNTGANNIGSFWYAWLPPDNFYDFLTSVPTGTTSPTGWTANLEGLNDGIDNSSIQWVSSSNPLTPGSTLHFDFTTPDNFATVTGNTDYYGFPVGYSYIYAGQPEFDPGALVNILPGSSTPAPEPAGLSILALAGTSLLLRRGAWHRRPADV